MADGVEVNVRHGSPRSVLAGATNGCNRIRIAPHRLNAVISSMDQKIHQRLPLTELASVAGMSPFHFCRFFSIQLGSALQKFVKPDA